MAWNNVRKKTDDLKSFEINAYNAYPSDVLAAVSMAFTVTGETCFLLTQEETTCTYLQ